MSGSCQAVVRQLQNVKKSPASVVNTKLRSVDAIAKLRINVREVDVVKGTIAEASEAF